MEDLDPNSALEMLWDDTPALTLKQVELLNNNRDRAMRLRLARRKKCEAVEKHRRKWELEELADHLKGVLMTRLFDMLNKETNITLMDSKLLSARAAIRVMAASDSVDSLVSSGSMTSRRMHISWSLNIEIQSMDDRRTALLDMAREWLSEVVCRRVVVRSEAKGWLWEIIDNIRDSNHMTTDGSVPASMMEEVMKGMEMLPTPDSVKRQDQMEVGMGMLSLSTPDVGRGD